MGMSSPGGPTSISGTHSIKITGTPLQIWCELWYLAVDQASDPVGEVGPGRLQGVEALLAPEAEPRKMEKSGVSSGPNGLPSQKAGPRGRIQVRNQRWQVRALKKAQGGRVRDSLESCAQPQLQGTFRYPLVWVEGYLGYVRQAHGISKMGCLQAHFRAEDVKKERLTRSLLEQILFYVSFTDDEIEFQRN